VLAAIRAVGCFLGGLIVIFALMATTVLDDSTEVNRYGDPVNTGFKSISDSIYTSFVAMTTASLPDAVIPTYVHNHAMFWLWWLPFLLLGACLFTQVVLATVYNRYEEDNSSWLKERYKKRDEGVLRAFQHLRDCRTEDGQSAVSCDSFHALVDKLRTLALPIWLDADVIEAAFKALDEDRNGVLSSFEFFQMVDLLQHKFRRTRRDSFIRRRCGHTFLGRALTFVMDNGAKGPDLGYAARYHGSVCDRCMSIILGANTAWVVVLCAVDLNDLVEPAWFSPVNVFFSFVYLVEVALKLSYWSWGQYWLSTDNRFDFTSTMILAGAGVAFLSDNADRAILQYFNMVRLLRIVRLLKALNNIPSYRMQVEVISKMVGTCWDVLMMNVLVIYLWSAAGMQLFGGELYASNPRLQSQDLAYFKNHYEIYNFNDLPLGVVTLFFCMLGSWNDALASVCLALSQRLSMFWFLAGVFHWSFYIASPLLAFNVYTAFSIDVFCQLKDSSEMQDKQEVELVERLKSNHLAEMAAKGYCLHIEETADFSRMKLHRSMLESESSTKWNDFENAVTRIADSNNIPADSAQDLFSTAGSRHVSFVPPEATPDEQERRSQCSTSRLPGPESPATNPEVRNAAEAVENGQQPQGSGQWLQDIFSAVGLSCARRERDGEDGDGLLPAISPRRGAVRCHPCYTSCT